MKIDEGRSKCRGEPWGCVGLCRSPRGCPLDGCYVIKTDLPASAASKQEVHDRYKDLTQVEQAFRTCKTTHLETCRSTYAPRRTCSSRSGGDAGRSYPAGLEPGSDSIGLDHRRGATAVEGAERDGNENQRGG